MENPQPTSEPQPIANLIAPALEKIRSLPVCFKTEAEQEEWVRAETVRKMPDRLRAAGYPERAIRHLGIMTGPGLAGAEDTLAKIGSHGILFLIGVRGPGKTQIATWVAAQRILKGGGAGVYRKALDLWQDIRATWRPGSEKTEDEIIRRYCKTGFLVIDEAQERGDTDADRQWCDRMLTHIVDHRYDGMLPTLLVANLSVENYERTVPASIRSRIHESGGVKLCDWPSYR